MKPKNIILLKTSKYRWILLTAGFFILMCLGVAYSWGIFIHPITEEFGWTRTSVSLAVSILLLLFSIFMPIGGFLEQKITPRNTSIIGGFLVFLGWILASYTKSLLWLYLTYGFFCGIGTGLSYLPALSTGIKWFKDKKGLATGIIVSGFGVGSAFLAPVGVKLISLYGWRRTMFAYGMLFGIIICSASFFLKLPIDEKKYNKKDDEKNVNNKEFTYYQMIKTLTFKIIFFTYFLAMVAGMMVIGHIVPFLEDVGYKSIHASFSITFLSLFNGIGRILAGFFSDKIGRENVLFLLFLFTGIALLILPIFPNIYFVYLSSGLIGFCFGGFLSIYPVLTSDYFGTKYFGVNYGIVFIGYGAGCFVGPLLGGLLFDRMKNYGVAFITAGIVSIIGAIIVLFCLKKRQIEQSYIST